MSALAMCFAEVKVAEVLGVMLDCLTKVKYKNRKAAFRERPVRPCWSHTSQIRCNTCDVIGSFCDGMCDIVIFMARSMDVCTKVFFGGCLLAI